MLFETVKPSLPINEFNWDFASEKPVYEIPLKSTKTFDQHHGHIQKHKQNLFTLNRT